MVNRIAILALALLTILAACSVFLTARHFRISSLSNAEITRFLLPSSGPRRLKEGCSELKNAITTAADQSHSKSERPVGSVIPLSQDEIAIYRAVLGNAIERGWRRLNVSIVTYPLSATDLDRCDCFDDIDFDDLSVAFHSFHDLPDTVLPVKEMSLVNRAKQSSLVRANDPSNTMREGKTVKDAVDTAFRTGLFSMSEIAFDREHLRAVVSYRFWCGLLCGSGATLVVEKFGSEWRLSERDCGSWVS